MIEAIKTFFAPFMNECGKHLSVGFLGKEVGSMSISPMPKRTMRRTYVDGDVMQTDTYDFSIRVPYGVTGVPEGIDDVFAALMAFIRDRNRNSIFPVFPDGEIAVSVSCDLPEKPDSIAANSCVFTASIHFTYYKMHQKGSIS